MKKPTIHSLKKDLKSTEEEATSYLSRLNEFERRYFELRAEVERLKIENAGLIETGRLLLVAVRDYQAKRI